MSHPRVKSLSYSIGTGPKMHEQLSRIDSVINNEIQRLVGDGNKVQRLVIETCPIAEKTGAQSIWRFVTITYIQEE
jgi:hypothetical protein